jgi:ankyrin repeat protein
MDGRLFNACKTPDSKRALKLISESADATWVGPRGDTALIWACHHNMTGVVSALLKTDCLPHHANNAGTTALMIACQQNMDHTALKLLKTDCRPHRVDGGGETALGWACYKNNIDLAQILVEMGCDSTVECSDSFTAIDYALQHYRRLPPNDKYVRLLLAMRGCHDPTPSQLSNSVFNDVHDVGHLYLTEIKRRIDKSIIQTRVFRRWAVRSRLTRLARHIPRGPVGIILGYL